MTTRLLVADDESDIRVLVGVRLRHLDVEIVEAIDGAAAMALASGEQLPALAVLDQRMPGPTGLQVAEVLRGRSVALPVTIFSAFVDEELVRAARELDVAIHTKSDLRALVAWVEQQLAGAPA